MQDSKDTAKLPREEWDFRHCPELWIPTCDDYEYNREAVLNDPNSSKGDRKLYVESFLKRDDYKRAFEMGDAAFVHVPHGIITWMPEGIRKEEWGKLNGTSQYLAILMHWEYTDDTLKKCFADWLLDNRPIKATQSKRGRSEIKESEANLKALGAYRLLKEMTVPEAKTHTTEICGRPLFSADASWYKANRKAILRLKKIQRLRDWIEDHAGPVVHVEVVDDSNDIADNDTD